MAVAVEQVAQRYENIVAGVPISVPFPAYEVTDISVYYGTPAQVAARGVDYVVTLGNGFDTFTVTPTTALLNKINSLIAANPTVETNYITVRRALNYKTESTPPNVRYTPFTSREFDRTALRFQQLAEQMNRALVLSPDFVGSAPLLQLRSREPGRVLRFSDDGTSVVPGPTGNEIENAQQYAEYAEASALAAAASATAAGAEKTAAEVAAAEAAASAVAAAQNQVVDALHVPADPGKTPLLSRERTIQVVRDTSGRNLWDFANGASIGDGVTHCDAAMAAALTLNRRVVLPRYIPGTDTLAAYKFYAPIVVGDDYLIEALTGQAIVRGPADNLFLVNGSRSKVKGIINNGTDQNNASHAMFMFNTSLGGSAIIGMELEDVVNDNGMRFIADNGGSRSVVSLKSKDLMAYRPRARALNLSKFWADNIFSGTVDLTGNSSFASGSYSPVNTSVNYIENAQGAVFRDWHTQGRGTNADPSGLSGQHAIDIFNSAAVHITGPSYMDSVGGIGIRARQCNGLYIHDTPVSLCMQGGLDLEDIQNLFIDNVQQYGSRANGLAPANRPGIRLRNIPLARIDGLAARDNTGRGIEFGATGGSQGQVQVSGIRSFNNMASGIVLDAFDRGQFTGVLSNGNGGRGIEEINGSDFNSFVGGQTLGNVQGNGLFTGAASRRSEFLVNSGGYSSGTGAGAW